MAINVSIGIITYNEAEILCLLLAALRNQKTKQVKIREIIVVASACTDDTCNIVRQVSKVDKRIQLMIQPKREGKASAINLFLKKAKYKICILESGDTVPLPSAVEELVAPFINKKVGLSGAHPIPVNPISNFISYTVNFNWWLTHALSLRKPRLGEMIAFRKVFCKIPQNTAVDEACIEALVRKHNLEVVYAPRSIVRNKGPESISDYLRQSRRIYAGHLHLEKTMGYRVASKNMDLVFAVLIENLKLDKYLPWAIGAVMLEAFGRFLGMYDFYIKKKNPYIWKIAITTKTLDKNDKNLFQNTRL